MPNTSTIERVGVVGCGQMGAGIAEVCARAGLQVLVAEEDQEGIARGRERIHGSLHRAVRAGKLDAEAAEAARLRLAFTADLDAFADRQVVIEAVAEVEALKTSLLARLDKIVDAPDAVVATNTSSIPITRLASATARPDRVLGMHFFNPAPVLPLVELVPCLLTSERTRDRAERFVSGSLGKRAIVCGDRAGFVVNRLLIPYLLAAVRMAESGFAAPDDIDGGMVAGCAHPMGPLRLADLIGLDTVRAAAEAMYEEFKEPLYAPPAMLLRMVESGRLGRKSGRGFYRYDRS